MKKTIIFDFDGVLSADSKILEKFLTNLLPFSNKSKIKEIIINNTIKNKANNVIVRFLRRQGSKIYLNFLKKTSIEDSYLEDIDIQYKLLETINDLDTDSYLLTSNYLSVCKYLLKDNINIFKKTFTFSEVKSKSAAIDTWVKDKSIDLKSTIFITDTVGDILEFKKYTDKKNIFGVTWGFHEKTLISKFLDDSNIINSPDELIEVLINFDNTPLIK